MGARPLMVFHSKSFYIEMQRPVMIQNMTITEFEEGKREDKMLIIQVCNHKTIGSFGTANIIYENKMEILMQQYYKNIRK